MGALTQNLALEVEGLGKYFDIYPSDRARLLEFLGDRTHHVEHWALRGLSFQVARGQAFGVIGSNGAGKSTLLRVLAGITEPSEGRVTAHGRLATLLDLGVSFHDHFTGRENIRLNCALLGLGEEETEIRIPEIIRFAELGAFIDHPMRTWSTGMNLRLGFSIAVHSDADILLVDEVLAVGDQYFQRKCIRRIEELLGRGSTLVLVTHDLHAVRHLCQEVLWLDGGTCRALGDPREVVERYLELDRLRSATPRVAAPLRMPVEPRPRALPASPRIESDPEFLKKCAAACALAEPQQLFEEEAGEAPRRMNGEDPVVVGTGEIRILRVQFLDAEAVGRSHFQTGDDLVVAVTIRTTEPVESPVFGVALFRDDGSYLYGPNTRFDGVLEGIFHGVYTFFIRYPGLPLLGGTWRISVAFFDKGHVRPHVWHNQLYEIRVSAAAEDHGMVQLPHRWGLLTHYEPT